MTEPRIFVSVSLNDNKLTLRVFSGDRLAFETPLGLRNAVVLMADLAHCVTARWQKSIRPEDDLS